MLIQYEALRKFPAVQRNTSDGICQSLLNASPLQDCMSSDYRQATEVCLGAGVIASSPSYSWARSRTVSDTDTPSSPYGTPLSSGTVVKRPLHKGRGLPSTRPLKSRRNPTTNLSGGQYVGGIGRETENLCCYDNSLRVLVPESVRAATSGAMAVSKDVLSTRPRVIMHCSLVPDQSQPETCQKRVDETDTAKGEVEDAAEHQIQGTLSSALEEISNAAISSGHNFQSHKLANFQSRAQPTGDRLPESAPSTGGQGAAFGSLAQFHSDLRDWFNGTLCLCAGSPTWTINSAAGPLISHSFLFGCRRIGCSKGSL